MEVLVWESKELGEVGLKKAWALYLRDMFAQGSPVSNNGDLLKTMNGLSDDDVSKLRLFGKQREDTVVFDRGVSTSYVELIQAHEQEVWYCHLIPEEYLLGVTGYVRQELPPEWLPPLVI